MLSEILHDHRNNFDFSFSHSHVTKCYFCTTHIKWRQSEVVRNGNFASYVRAVSESTIPANSSNAWLSFQGSAENSIPELFSFFFQQTTANPVSQAPAILTPITLWRASHMAAIRSLSCNGACLRTVCWMRTQQTRRQTCMASSPSPPQPPSAAPRASSPSAAWWTAWLRTRSSSVSTKLAPHHLDFPFCQWGNPAVDKLRLSVFNKY